MTKTDTREAKAVASRTRKPKTAPAAVASLPPVAGGKIGILVGLLRKPDGARIDEMMAATGWQAHSVRGALSGAIKKKLALPVTSEPTPAGRLYRITPPGGAA